MVAIGLFWIAEDAVYLGTEPLGTASGVRLTNDGVHALGRDHGRSWSWREVRGIDVHGVAVRSAARRALSVAYEALMVASSGHGEEPPGYTVAVETAEDGVVEVPVISAVSGGIHTPEEYALSRTLLRRIAEGSASVDGPLAWRRDRSRDGTPRRAEREALLEEWAGRA